jgi:hypothetical protein
MVVILLVEEIGVPEKSTDMPQVTDNFIFFIGGGGYFQL